MKDLRDLNDLTIHDLQPISDEYTSLNTTTGWPSRQHRGSSRAREEREDAASEQRSCQLTNTVNLRILPQHDNNRVAYPAAQRRRAREDRPESKRGKRGRRVRAAGADRSAVNLRILSTYERCQLTNIPHVNLHILPQYNNRLAYPAAQRSKRGKRGSQRRSKRGKRGRRVRAAGAGGRS